MSASLGPPAALISCPLFFFFFFLFPFLAEMFMGVQLRVLTLITDVQPLCLCLVVAGR